MEISDSTIGIFYLSKIFALAPMAISRNSKGILEIKRSPLFIVYTLTLIFGTAFFTYQGLLFDTSSNITVRTESATSNVVRIFEMSVLLLATVAGAFCGIFGLNPIQEFNERLRKIDESLHSYEHLKRDRIRSILVLIISLIFIVILLGLDAWVRLSASESMNINGTNTEFHFLHYIATYILYLILTVLHISFANTTYGISLRCHRLNMVLKNTFQTGNKTEKPTRSKITIVKALLDPKSTLNEISQLDGKDKNLVIRIMAENHGSLARCVAIVSSSYGMAVLFMLVSCLLNLVAEAYFLFLQLISKNESRSVWLEVLWIMFHTLRLLMVVEPCHLTTRESRRTLQIMCDIESKEHDPVIAEKVKKYLQQMLIQDAQFNAIGLCKVDRNILTSFASAITTYLVILIQFQKTNG